MAILGKLNNLTIQYGETIVLKKVKADILKGVRIGVVGPNGAGKSSLLQAIAEGNSGVEWQGAVPDIVYMQQEVKEWTDCVPSVETRKLEEKWNVPESRNCLSGGEGMKMRLAQALAEKAELLLLDEPTNHLDAESVELVIEQLVSYKGTLIIISHDRYFIDKIANCIWEIEDGELNVYKGNYSAALLEKAHIRLTQQRKYDKQQAKIARVESQIDELKSWSGKAHADSTKQEFAKEFYRSKAKRMDVQIRSKQKRLEAELDQERVEKPKEEKAVAFEIAGGSKKGKRVIELKNAGVRFGPRILFDAASFTIQHGERVGLVGRNGSGKSTLFNILRGEQVFSGEVWTTTGMKIGYLSQNVFDLPEEKTPAELFGPQNFEQAGRIRTLMDNLGFGKEHWSQPILHMSMGERVKLKLMEFMLAECNVLLLDEPTNHLDLPSREQLEKTLESFEGTLLIATHDRYFMERLANKLLLFDQERLVKYEGSYREWQDKKAERKENRENEILALETERQAVLGKLSFMQPNDKKYAELDSRFNQLTKEIQAIRTN
ncbi:ribosomal protection-like ABC-F family protein [Planomicrobium sp. CPCC 101079]|uniref:ribosomal protection-like ABC-F family protein n=1 Tax=Planomicrobium sp. CPCC 101079 TaxID=2599618 RepID=UPI0011B650DC|nr:ABC-F family ATP-binding cassette domain-containing protein [Planomicrobium sp. CPCC 101079]TWT02270.1 ABC-F family ATP-binding cassette domain-containing protein [Planomicrobium sp. CPCC 101079]